MWKKSLCGAAVGVLTVIATSTGAAASSAAVDDPRGDNYTAGYDITAARYTNAANKVVSTVWLTDLRNRTYADFWIASRNGSNTYGVVVKRKNGKVRSQLWHYAIEGPGTKVNCDVATVWSPKADSIRVSVPWSCVDLKKRVVRVNTIVSRKGADTWSDSSKVRKVTHD